MGAPTKLGAGGVEEVVVLKLTADEKKMLKASAAAVREVVDILKKIAMELGLRGRTAIVCGASAGIGLAIAEALTEEGANVAMFARGASGSNARPSASGARGRWGRDRPGRPRRLVRLTVDTFGGIDILVNNSGGPPRTPGTGLEAAQVEAAVDLLLVSVVSPQASACPSSRRARRGAS